MTVTFDPNKRLLTLQQRGIDFAVDANKVFAGRTVTTVDDRFDYGEVRQLTIGWLDGRMVVMIWTQRIQPHIISMRYCHDKEESKFLQRFDNEGTVGRSG